MKKILNELKKFKLKDLFNKERLKKFINYEKELASNPQKLAFSIATGIFIGLTIPMGFQTIIAIPVSFLLRINVFVVYISTLITNPFTAVFIYFIMFKVGEIITGNHIPIEQLEQILDNPSISQIIQFGTGALVNYLIGMTIITALITPLSYFLVIFYVIRRRQRKSSSVVKSNNCF
jgi:uncharacterized protein (DUF2062 family)